MSSKKLLNEDQVQVLYRQYHAYISNCKRAKVNPELNDFFGYLKKSDEQFRKFTIKQLSNQIIAYRRQFGNLLWPNLNNLKNYISPTSRIFIEK